LRGLRLCALDHFGQRIDLSSVPAFIFRPAICEIPSAAGVHLQRVQEEKSSVVMAALFDQGMFDRVPMPMLIW